MLSTQIQDLEQRLGQHLFARSDRTLALTEVARAIFTHGEEIFAIGDELTEMLAGRSVGCTKPPLQFGSARSASVLLKAFGQAARVCFQFHQSAREGAPGGTMLGRSESRRVWSSASMRFRSEGDSLIHPSQRFVLRLERSSSIRTSGHRSMNMSDEHLQPEKFGNRLGSVFGID